MTTLALDPLKVTAGQIVRMPHTELTILSTPTMVGYFSEGVQRWACDALQTTGKRVLKIRLEMARC